VIEAGRAPHRATDLAIEVDSIREQTPARLLREVQRARRLRHSEGLQQALGGLGIQAHHRNVERGAACGIDCAVRPLHGQRRLLQVQRHRAIRAETEHSVPAGLLRRGVAAEGCEAGLREVDLAGIETDQGIAGHHNHLPASGSARRKGQEAGHQPVEQGGGHGRGARGRERNEDLAARPVGRKAAGVAARVHDQNTKLAQNCGHALRPSAPAPLALDDADQAQQRAATAADALSPDIGNHQDLSHLRQHPALAPQPQLRFIRFGLRGVRCRQNEVVPRQGRCAHWRMRKTNA